MPGVSPTLEQLAAMVYGISNGDGWTVVYGPGYALPPAPGNEVKVWGFGNRSAGGWAGERVRIYAYPIEEDMRGMDLWPRSGEDMAVEECLRQTAFLLGEGPVGADGQLDFVLPLPHTVHRAGEEHSLEGLASLGDLALFAVTDTGSFFVGPSIQLAAPYRLTVTPERAALGETVVIEGSGFAPARGSVVVSTPVVWPSGDTSGRALVDVEIGRAPTPDGSFRLEWTAPESLPYDPAIGIFNPRSCAFPPDPHLAEWGIEILVTVLDPAGNPLRDDYRVFLCVAL